MPKLGEGEGYLPSMYTHRHKGGRKEAGLGVVAKSGNKPAECEIPELTCKALWRRRRM